MATQIPLPARRPEAPTVDSAPCSIEAYSVGASPARRTRAWLHISLTVLLAFAAGGLAGGVTASLVAGDASPPATVAPAVTTVVYPEMPGAVTLPGLIAQINRSVVAIDVTSRTSVGSRGQAITGENFGTGFVLSASGLIATAAHVVEDAVMISVTMPDGSIARGTVVSQDTEADLAVIKVERVGLVPVLLGSSSSIRPGEIVVAVGNALALEGGPSATLGIISAVDRTITTSDGTTYTNLIQVDAAINSGDSGGPLVNGSGQVVGVNTAVVIASEGTNIGFAIPIDRAGPILLKLAGLR